MLQRQSELERMGYRISELASDLHVPDRKGLTVWRAATAYLHFPTFLHGELLTALSVFSLCCLLNHLEVQFPRPYLIRLVCYLCHWPAASLCHSALPVWWGWLAFRWEGVVRWWWEPQVRRPEVWVAVKSCPQVAVRLKEITSLSFPSLMCKMGPVIPLLSNFTMLLLWLNNII